MRVPRSLKDQSSIYLNMRNRSLGSEKTHLWTHLYETWSSEEWGFPLLCLSAHPLMSQGFTMSSCQDSAMAIAFCWQITKMILVLLSILHPLGLPRESHMPGRALLWSVTHLVLSFAPPWVQAITICQLHNFRTSLSELTEDGKRKKKQAKKQTARKKPNRPRTNHCYRKQKGSYCRGALLISSTNCFCHHPETCCRHSLSGNISPRYFHPHSLLSCGTGAWVGESPLPPAQK